MSRSRDGDGGGVRMFERWVERPLSCSLVRAIADVAVRRHGEVDVALALGISAHEFWRLRRSGYCPVWSRFAGLCDLAGLSRVERARCWVMVMAPDDVVQHTTWVVSPTRCVVLNTAGTDLCEDLRQRFGGYDRKGVSDRAQSLLRVSSFSPDGFEFFSDVDVKRKTRGRPPHMPTPWHKWIELLILRVRGWTHADLASNLGLGPFQWHRWWKTRWKKLPPEMLVRLADFAGATFEDARRVWLLSLDEKSRAWEDLVFTEEGVRPAHQPDPTCAVRRDETTGTDELPSLAPVHSPKNGEEGNGDE